MQPQRRGMSYYVSCFSQKLALAFPKQEAGAEAMKLDMKAQKSIGAALRTESCSQRIFN